MKRYTPVFASVSQVSRTVPFDGLTMREIYQRFVMTGQRPVENKTSSVASEDDPYNPDQDAISRAQDIAFRNSVVSEAAEVAEPVVQDKVDE